MSMHQAGSGVHWTDHHLQRPIKLLKQCSTTPASLKVQHCGTKTSFNCVMDTINTYSKISLMHSIMHVFFLCCCFFDFPEVAEELCKTASSGHCGPVHSFSHDMPLLPSKSRASHKHTENKENIEGGLDGRPDSTAHGHSGTARSGRRATNLSRPPQYDSAGAPENIDGQSTLQRRRARRLKRRAVIFLQD